MGMLSKIFGPEPKFKQPRVWSNQELRKIGPHLQGAVVNVSGWKDSDKEGGNYRSYFPKNTEYFITNYSSTYKGFQGNGDEIALDLVQPLPAELVGRFDIVFNHTTLEHIFEVQVAFENLAKMSRNHVLVVVPFLQQQHGPEYGDFWRFTPLAMKRLMEKNGLELTYINYNDSATDSIYIIALGSKTKNADLQSLEGNKVNVIDSTFIGTKIIKRRIFRF